MALKSEYDGDSGNVILGTRILAVCQCSGRETDLSGECPVVGKTPCYGTVDVKALSERIVRKRIAYDVRIVRVVTDE